MTFFVVVVAAGILLAWIAHSLSWIQQRHEMLAVHNELLASDGLTAENYYSEDGREVVSAPWHIRLLGEHGYADIWVAFRDDFRFRLTNNVGPDDEDKRLTHQEREFLARVRELFPEATVRPWIGNVPILDHGVFEVRR